MRPTANYQVKVYRGVLTGLSFFGLLAGPLIGGALTEYTTWRWCKQSSPEGSHLCRATY